MSLEELAVTPVVRIQLLVLKDGQQFHRVRACITDGVIYVETTVNGQETVNAYSASDLTKAEIISRADVTDLKW